VTGLTGRIDSPPADILREEVLDPQFAREAGTLLPWYVAVEKVLLLEYRRMGLLSPTQARTIGSRLDEISADRIAADGTGNLSDIAFAIERYVHDGPVPPPGAWHVDRSRNDLQSCAQLLYARGELASLVARAGTLARAAVDLAATGTRLPMPGYTHLQAAQTITPGFYLCALAEETLRAMRQLRATHDAISECPLGAGAMAGQELEWDLDRLAQLLTFDRPARHALVAVASRGWALRIGGDLSAYGVVLGRFVTDLMTWSSGAYGFLDLPDAMAGISSAMPQKRNFPVLERIRGRTAHLTSLSLDLTLTQRATPYANMVEVSKEAGTYLPGLFATATSVLRLATTVLAQLRFVPDRMRAACEQDYLGGFRLANLLTLREGIPWREAQVVAGRYIAVAVREGRPASRPDAELLRRSAPGFALTEPAKLLAEAFDVDAGLTAKASAGATGPEPVERLLDAQRAELDDHAGWCAARRDATAAAMAAIDRELEVPHAV